MPVYLTQAALVVSAVDEVPRATVSQAAMILSLTDTPPVQLTELAVIVSITPDRPYNYGASKIGGTAGPLNLLVDMDQNSRN